MVEPFRVVRAAPAVQVLEMCKALAPLQVLQHHCVVSILQTSISTFGYTSRAVGQPLEENDMDRGGKSEE